VKRNRISTLAAMLLSLMLCFLLVPAPKAFAADITVSGVTVTPSSLSKGGNVTVKGKIKNTVGEEITVSISYAEDVKVNKTIAAGGSYSFSITCGISTSDLNSSNTYVVVDWASDSHNGTKKVPFTVKHQAEQAALTFTRSISKTSVKAGDSVKLTYSLKNTGSANISGLKITDPAVPDDVVSGLSLKAGASKTITKTIQPTETVTSTPKATFTAGGRSHTQTVDSKKITVAAGEPKLSISAIVDKALINSGDTVTFTIALRNDSSVAINNIDITDSLGHTIKSGLSIGASLENNTKTQTFTYQTSLTSPQSVTFKATYPSGEETKTATSSAVVVNINGQPFISSTSSNISITATADPATLALPGDVTFTVTVENIGSVALKDVAVTESRLGTLGTFSTLEIGEKQTLTKQVTVSAPGSYLFQVTAKDSDDMQYSASSENISVSEPVASATATDDTLNPSGSDTLSTLFIIMLVIVGLIIIAGITLAVLVMQEKRAKKLGGPKGGPHPPKGGVSHNSHSRNARAPASHAHRAQQDQPHRRPPQRSHRDEALFAPDDEDEPLSLPPRRRPPQQRAHREEDLFAQENDENLSLPPRRAKMPTIGDEEEPVVSGRVRENQKYYRRAAAADDGNMTKPFSKKEIEQAKLQMRRQHQAEQAEGAAQRRRPPEQAPHPQRRRPPQEQEARQQRPVRRPVSEEQRPPHRTAPNRFAQDEEEFFSSHQQAHKRPVREEAPEFRPRSRRQMDNDPGYGPSNKRKKR
jgi:uncharacterized repeat protein (TIGR01451 family)